MRTLKKVAAILCGATILTAIGATAYIAYAQESVDMNDRAAELSSDSTNIVADQVYAYAGEKVAYTVNLVNNSGYALSGIQLFYDKRLTISKVNADLPQASAGKAAEGLTQSYVLNEDQGLIAISTMGGELCKNDGVYVTVWFTVPENAQVGDKYDMNLVVDRWRDVGSTELPHQAVNGWIVVKEQGTTSSTTTSSTTTSTTTSTSETTSTSSSTTSSSTSSETTSSTTTSSTTTTSSSSKPTDTTTSTTATEGPTNTTLSKTKPTKINPVVPSTTKPSGVKTGDAGVGVAVAGLLAAAGAAVAVSAKRREK